MSKKKELLASDQLEMDRKRKEFEEERREVKAQEMKAEETHFELIQIKEKVMH